MHQPREASSLLKGPIRDLGDDGAMTWPERTESFQSILELTVAMACVSTEQFVKKKENK